ncbi:MAG: AAA family ATPase [Bacteroidetes bacterium]|nr:AAA family ATPase [Bacteroidota bacterium]
MNEITLEDYRCFHTRQVARLAPLTLLVGDNSTGKTSLLAMIRVLWDCIYNDYDPRIPNFKEEPFDFGSFDEIAHHRSERSGPASTFEAGVSIDQGLEAEFVFGKEGTIPEPVKVRFADGDNWIENRYDDEGNHKMRVGTRRGTWEIPAPWNVPGRAMSLLTPRWLLSLMGRGIFYADDGKAKSREFIRLDGTPSFSRTDADSIAGSRFLNFRPAKERPYVSAPIRSKPRRTYDPAILTPDPEGDHVPMLMADLAVKDDGVWTNLKQELERFGSSAGIFDEINVKRFGKSGSAPFQIHVRKSGNKRKGPKQNLIDVGYGISQVLPILTELLQPNISRIALLQQPEVHLHPSAQAALGSLFCRVAGRGRQLVIETHSDRLIDRIRMDVRDSETELKPEDVSILFFERNDLSVQIHSIRIDNLGNVLDAPDNYGRFFMEETKRSLGI